MVVKFDQLLMNGYLERAITEFTSNPLSARLIRRMANEVPDRFVAAALRYLDTPDQSSAHHFLTSLMLRQDSILDEVADPARGTLPRSLNLFHRLSKIDPCFDVRLARQLPDRSGHNHAEAFDRARSCRVLDILNETSVGRRLVPILGHLVDSADTVLAARATLFIGRRMQSPDWAARQMTRGNPDEVRANAVESIWGMKSSSAQSLLENCLTDESVRVAGNALVGLHKLGKPGIMEQITEMVNADAAVFRTTAAWTMGKIGDSAFADPLTGLLKDASPEVRSAALQSLLQLRKSEAAVRKEVAREEAAREVAAKEAAAKKALAPVPVQPVVESFVKPEPPAPTIDMEIRLDGSARSTRSDRLKG